ncbi:MAG: family 10 glycosylhydrolase [Tannerellaceae bacterium]|jgi:uncharacterized lipoprotein YddW (UPF0748 family)|nr:family 10 glycosylhydrolase [Tannerellaceae bacterium]
MRFLSLLAFLLLSLHLQAVDYPKREMRAVWIATIYGMDWPSRPATNESSRRLQQQELCDKLDMLRSCNFNTVFLQVRLRGDVIYPSAIEPFNSVFTGRLGGNPGYDPLAFAINECHKRNLECHAWIVTYPMGTAAAVRSNRGSAVRKRPDLCKLYNGEWYMDPGLPGTSEYLYELVAELIAGYDIDGVHFDYIRYPDHADGFPDAATYSRYGQSKTIREWREDNISRTIERIYRLVKSQKPWVQVSSSPLGKYSRIKIVPNAGQTGLSVYQDAQKWLHDEIHDFVAPMLYFKDMFFYPFVKNWMIYKANRYVVAGLAPYRMMPPDNWTADEITRQINYLRLSNVDGIAFFRGAQIFRNAKGIRDSLQNRYFRYPALLPPLFWLSDEKPPAPFNLTVGMDGRQIRLSWDVAASGRTEVTSFTVYASPGSSVDIENPANIIATGLRRQEARFDISTDIEQGYTFRITASDRYHIESNPSKDVYYYISTYAK